MFIWFLIDFAGNSVSWGRGAWVWSFVCVGEWVLGLIGSGLGWVDRRVVNLGCSLLNWVRMDLRFNFVWFDSLHATELNEFSIDELN